MSLQNELDEFTEWVGWVYRMNRMSLQNEWNESTEEVGWVYRMSGWVYRMSGMITEWVEWL